MDFMIKLEDLIPTRDSNWQIKGEYLLYKKYANIPVAYIEDSVVYIFLDLKIVNQISKLIRHLSSKRIEFYFDSPEFSNPSTDLKDHDRKVILHYLFSYAHQSIFIEFRKIQFDLIKNMVQYCDKNNCVDLLKDAFESTKLIVQRGYHDFYTNKMKYDYSKEIREEFENLYRDIQISRII